MVCMCVLVCSPSDKCVLESPILGHFGLDRALKITSFQHHISGRADLGAFCGVCAPTSVSGGVRGTPGGSGQSWISQWDALLMPEHRHSHLFG